MDDSAKSTILGLIQNIRSAAQSKDWDKIVDAVELAKNVVEQMPVARTQQLKPTFHLNMIEEEDQKSIIKKFNIISGGLFYHSCKTARTLVEKTKPVWCFSGSQLYHFGNRQCYRVAVESSPGVSSIQDFPLNCPLKFCRIEEVMISHCDGNYIQTVVLPEITSIGSVGTLFIGSLGESGSQLLCAAVKHDTLKLADICDDEFSAIFSAERNLKILVNPPIAASYWQGNKVFELARTRKTLTLMFDRFYKEMITYFIKNWLLGEPLGTLEKFTIEVSGCILTKEEENSLKNDFENMMQCFVQTPEGFVVPRGSGMLRVVLDLQTYMIHTYVL